MAKRKRKLKRKILIRRIQLGAVLALLLGLIVYFAVSCRGGRDQPEELESPLDSTQQEQQDEQSAEPRQIVDPTTPYDYDRVAQELEQLRQTYPELISVFSFGESVEGRELLAAAVGSGEITVVLTGAIHGNESFATNFLMYLLDGYAYGWATDQQLGDWSYRELLQNVRLVVAPMLNPDGVNISLYGPEAAADPESILEMDTTGTDYSYWKSNANGVDINRNFPYNWSEYNETQWPALRYYVGPYAASEPETRAIMSLLEVTEPDALLDFHIYGEVVYWNDTLSGQHEEDHRELAEQIMELTGYGDAGEEEVDDFAGYLSNYARGVYGIFAATVELTPEQDYPVEEFYDAVEQVYPIGLLVADYLCSEQQAPALQESSG